MAKMKYSGGNEVDWDGLDEEGFDPDDTGDFVDYDGEVPPAGILLNGDVTKLWLVQSQAGDWMYKALFVADCGHDKDDEGLCEEDCEKSEYNGCPVWDNVLWSLPQVKFKWGHFLHSLNITLKDIKAKTIVDEEDNVGTPVKKVGTVKFPFPISIITAREIYQGETVARVKRWVPADDVEDDEEDEAPVAKTKAKSKTKAKAKAGAKTKKRRADDDDEDDVPF